MRLLAVLVVFLLIRWGVGVIRHTKDDFWYVWGLPLTVICLAFLKVTWTRVRFEELEVTIVGMLSSPSPEAARRWYAASITEMYNLRSCILTSVAFLPIIAFLLWNVGWGFWHADPVLKWFDYLSMVVLFSSAASSQWPFARISLFIMRLGKKNLEIDFFAHPKDSIIAVGGFMLKIALGAISLTVLLYVSLVTAATNIGLPAYIVFSSVLVWAFIWFFVTQLNIHAYMSQRKREKLRSVAKKLNDQIRLCVEQPTEEHLKAYNGLKEIHCQLSSLPEWPFRFQSVLALTTGVVLPIGLALLDLLKKK